MSKDEIFDKLKGILVSEFEIEEDAITPEATLFDDLELDSIDSIDLIQKMKEFMPADTKIDPAIFKTVKNIQDVVDALVPYMK
ncbi:MAG: acyl carrier protein [Treponema sp.]|nr:acyl carrier protein [Treponema sp.]